MVSQGMAVFPKVDEEVFWDPFPHEVQFGLGHYGGLAKSLP